MSTDLAFAPATDLADRIARGDLSPVELVETHLDRIDAHDDALNAYVHVAADRAREAAREAERAVADGAELGPLHGLPVAVKDLNDVAGMPTTDGSVPLADDVPETSEPLVERLEAAGAIVLGKTNTPEFGHKGTTDNRLFGPTSTPFAPDRNAGGSSGGSAAAVTAGLAPLAQGTDGGGSIRIPSSWCGCYGIKPTWRRVPRRYRPNGFSHTPFSDAGPHARTVADAALMLDAVSGLHPTDPMVSPDDDVDYLSAVDRPIDGLDVAYSPDLDVFPVDERVAAVVEDAAYAFEEAGATVTEVDLGLDYSRDRIIDAYLTGFQVGYAELAATLKRTRGIDYLGDDRTDACPAFVDLIEAGREYSAVEYRRADVVRTGVFDAVQSLFESYDLLVSPTLAVPPVENAGADEQTLGPTTVAGESVDPLVGWCLTYPFNMTGHPAANVPAGFTDGDLPVGLQLVGPRYDEGTVLAASAAFERVRPWHDGVRSRLAVGG